MSNFEDQINEDLQAFADFMDEAPTLRCGEGGCDSCNLAFHRACDPILALPKESFVLHDEAWEADTIREQPDIDPYSALGPDFYMELGGESGEG